MGNAKQVEREKMALITVNNEVDRIITVETGPLTRVDIFDYIHNVHGTGYAKVNLEDDTYDETFGITLALSRAEERIQRKLQKVLIRSL